MLLNFLLGEASTRPMLCNTLFHYSRCPEVMRLFLLCERSGSMLLGAAETLNFFFVLRELPDQILFPIPFEQFEISKIESRSHGTSYERVGSFWIDAFVYHVVVDAEPRSWISRRHHVLYFLPVQDVASETYLVHLVLFLVVDHQFERQS